jgi:DNA-binding GntR family transcriptional regulator
MARRTAAAADGSAPARLAEQVHEELLGRLLSHRFEPGQRLTVDALSRELGVSQTPIREALHRLEAGGVVVRTHLAGYRVGPQLTRDQFEDLVAVRLLLEPAAARAAAQHADDERAALLAELAGALADPALQGADGGAGLSFAAYARQDAAFHDAVAAASGNQVLRDTLAHLHVHVQLFRLGTGGHIRSEALEEHDAVVAAVTAHDPDAAEAAMRRHLERSAQRFAATFSGA